MLPLFSWNKNSGHDKAPQVFMYKSTPRRTKKFNYKNGLHKLIDTKDYQKTRPGEIMPNARYDAECRVETEKSEDERTTELM